MKLIWLIILLVAIGCADDSPNSIEPVEEDVEEDVVVSNVATLVNTLPANGGDAAYDRPVRLYFDKPPLAVSVNGTPAKVKGNLVCWDFPNGDTGTKSLRIEWTNPDGTKNVGANISLTVWNVSWAEMYLASGHIWDGTYDVDPDEFNQHPIRYNFTKEAVGVDAKLLSEDGVDLGWEAVWEDQTEKINGKLFEHQTLKLQRGPNGKLLEHGKRYMIQIVVDEAWIYFSDMCKCMECSWYKNHEFLITFGTAPEEGK